MDMDSEVAVDSEVKVAEDSVPKVPNEDGAASLIQDDDVVPYIPGSGVWERSENRRWVVVMNTNHRIPSMTRARSEGSLDPSLSIQRFVTNFEVEEQQPSNYRVISDGNSLVRIDRAVDTEEEAGGEQEEDPMEGSSGSQTRRVNTRARRRSTHLSSPDQPPPNVATVQGRGRRRRRRRRREKKFLLSGNILGRRKKWKREVILSVESSPGRDSPSPDTLRRIVERGLVVQGEEMKTVMEEEDMEEEATGGVSGLEVTGNIDTTDITSHSDSEDNPLD